MPGYKGRSHDCRPGYKARSHDCRPRYEAMSHDCRPWDEAGSHDYGLFSVLVCRCGSWRRWSVYMCCSAKEGAVSTPWP